MWKDEHSHPPAIFHSFNTTGGELDEEEVKAAIELVITTQGSEPYRTRLRALIPVIRKHFGELGWIAVRALPFMDSAFKSALRDATAQLKLDEDKEVAGNPFGVPIATGTWGGSGGVAGFCRAHVLPAPGVSQHHRD